MALDRKVLILGVTGQDGAYLASQMYDQGWKVFGGYRRGSSTGLWRLNALGLLDKITLVDVNLADSFNTLSVLRDIKPDQIYHLAGASFVADSFNQPTETIKANTFTVINVLNAMTLECPASRFFLAASSEIFGSSTDGLAFTETSPMSPANPYGVSKLAALQMASIYRKSHNLFASVGIMFNHESPLRARNFVTRKITYNIARLKIIGGDPILLGDLDSERDWGLASEYTKAMQLILQLDKPEDYLVATGKTTSVRTFLKLAAESAGFSPRFEGQGISEVCLDEESGTVLAKINERYFRKIDTPPIRGNPQKLEDACGWKAETKLSQLVHLMVEADIERTKKGILDV